MIRYDINFDPPTWSHQHDVTNMLRPLENCHSLHHTPKRVSLCKSPAGQGKFWSSLPKMRIVEIWNFVWVPQVGYSYIASIVQTASPNCITVGHLLCLQEVGLGHQGSPITTCRAVGAGYPDTTGGVLESDERLQRGRFVFASAWSGTWPQGFLDLLQVIWMFFAQRVYNGIQNFDPFVIFRESIGIFAGPSSSSPRNPCSVCKIWSRKVWLPDMAWATTVLWRWSAAVLCARIMDGPCHPFTKACTTPWID